MEAASAGHCGVAKILLQFGEGINNHQNEFKVRLINTDFNELNPNCQISHSPSVKKIFFKIRKSLKASNKNLCNFFANSDVRLNPLVLQRPPGNDPVSS